MAHRPLAQAGLLALALTALARPVSAQLLSFQEQRQLMRQMTQLMQGRMEQRLRCIDQASNPAQLQDCQRAGGAGWQRGVGMGNMGWGCPMW